jgi:hypothetical protein
MTSFELQVYVVVLQYGTGHLVPIGVGAAAATMPPWQSRSEQQVPRLWTHLKLVRSQLSLVQAILSLHCASLVHSMQPPLAGSQVSPTPHTELSGVCVHLPSALQLSIVHAIKSSQAASPQQLRQPTPGQQVPPLTQVSKVQLPPTHEPVLHGSVLVQSPLLEHCAVCTQPLLASHTKPVLHTLESSVWVQVPEAQASLVQSMPSSQSAAEQQLPQVDVPSPLAQHLAPAVEP